MKIILQNVCRIRDEGNWVFMKVFSVLLDRNKNLNFVTRKRDVAGI